MVSIRVAARAALAAVLLAQQVAPAVALTDYPDKVAPRLLRAAPSLLPALAKLDPTVVTDIKAAITELFTSFNNSAFDMLEQVTPILEQVRSAMSTVGSAVNIYTMSHLPGSAEVAKWYADLSAVLNKTFTSLNEKTLAAFSQSSAEIVSEINKVLGGADAVFDALTAAQDLLTQATASDGAILLAARLRTNADHKDILRLTERAGRSGVASSSLDEATAGKGKKAASLTEQATAAILKANSTITDFMDQLLELNATLPTVLNGIVEASRAVLGPVNATINSALAIPYLAKNPSLAGPLTAGFAQLAGLPDKLAALADVAVATAATELDEGIALLQTLYGVTADLMAEVESIANATM